MDIMTIVAASYFSQIAVSQATIRLVADQTSKAATTTISEDKQALSNAQLAESEQPSPLVDVTA
jgi:hypothetical protein